MPLRIFSQVGAKLSAKLAAAVADAEVVEVPVQGPLAEGLEAEILLTQTWGSENIAEVVARGVRWIHTLGTGVDRFPFDQVGGCRVSCSRGGSSIPIAEFVLASMLAFEKQMPRVWMHEAPENWYGERLGGLYGKTLGLVGLGGIATSVATRALAFEMQVLATRRSNAPSPVTGIEIASFEEVVSRADHLVIAASATAETRSLIGSEAFAVMKRGVHLVNIARGSLVDQDALRRALDDGTVACASLDTMTPEPLPAGHWMYDHPSVRLTPHVSWSMPGAVDLLMDRFLDNLDRYRKGEELANVVDPAKGY